MSPPSLVMSRCVAVATASEASQSTMRGSAGAARDSRISNSYSSRRDRIGEAIDGDAYSPRGAGRGSVLESISAYFAVARARSAARCSAEARPDGDRSPVAA